MTRKTLISTCLAALAAVALTGCAYPRHGDRDDDDRSHHDDDRWRHDGDWRHDRDHDRDHDWHR